MKRLSKFAEVIVGVLAAVGGHDLSGDCRLFWLSTQIFILLRLRAAFPAAAIPF